ncbi:MAG: molybdopterin-dependent oxidoreductase, partial [Chloroflexota bacterium]|nr:molybdopterin-dependent oxidoreductase [Chloroflexota bacterium]
YIAGADPMAAYPKAAEALDRLDLLIVQDLFMTATAERADFVLPAAAFAERDGTFTNAERRVQRFRQAREAPGESRPDWQILASLGRTLLQLMPENSVQDATTVRSRGKAIASASVRPAARPWVYRSTDDINDEIVKTVSIYSGASYAKLRSSGGVWGRQAPRDPVFYDGTSYTNTEGYGVQWPVLAEQSTVMFDLVFSQPETKAAADGALTLVTVPRLYDDGTLMRDSELLRFWVADPYVGLNREDAGQLEITSGDRVRLTSPAGSIELWARVDRDVPPGAALVPDLETIPLANVQTGVFTPVHIKKVGGV